jgi:hypothetical protein
MPLGLLGSTDMAVFISTLHVETVSVAKIAATRMESRPIQKGEMDTERASERYEC